MAFRQMNFYVILLFLVSLFAHQNAVHGWWWWHHHHQPLPAPAPGQAPSPWHHHHAYPDFFHYHKKIFVFGDSYADTGNSRLTEESWHCPYGMTIPRVPSGRYSDGLILTDFFAKRFGVIGPGPVPFQQWRKMISPFHLFGSSIFGMNFAHGGTGVFDTLVSAPNMTAQIDLFEQVMSSHYRGFDLNNSIALVTNSGNDYAAFMHNQDNDTVVAADLLGFSPKVTDQLVSNLKRIQALGIKKIAVASLPPLGCLPRVTVSNSYKHCDDTVGSLVDTHNGALSKSVGDLNQATANNTFVLLDLDKAFKDVLQGKEYAYRFPDSLRGCCVGKTSYNYCGDVDKQWRPLYTVCPNRLRSFFWDMDHPTMSGWEAVFERLLPTLQLLE
ncbi:hypothetical protein MLD38_021267 [Melastoma candidum]|uniref:Uncharacterized protein n=1 Tax=Melastoma candidum TaxID=119954 RepID=A0ACB9QJF2_9MYRT|nr:hypothetical protein MLD38_021267 [Melastoma candidum]